MIQDPHALKQAVLQKGLFDEAFYEANYGETIPPGEPAIDHFVRVGHERGSAPCAAFDPVLHRVLHGEMSPAEWPDRAQAERFTPVAAHLFPALDFQIYFWAGRQADELKANMGEMLANPTRPVKLPTGYGVYKFRNPPSEEVFRWIRKGVPFSFVRIPHGFWDCCNAVDRVSRGLAADARAQGLNDAQRRALAIRLFASRQPENGNFGGDYIDTVLDDLSHHPRDADLLTGIAFKGSPTFEDSAFGLGPPTAHNLDRAATFMRLFSPHDRLYDAMVWKRWAILGGLRDLPDALRRRPLILVARESFGVLAERLGLPQLVMVDIPGERTQLIRRQVLARIEAAIQDQLDRRPLETPVVLLQSGASLGYWFVRRLRLRFPKVIYLDLGEALNIWSPGKIDLWVEPYLDQIKRACLDPLRLAGADQP